VNLFIPVLYICLNGQCAFLQQLAVYQDEAECKQSVAEKKDWYKKNTNATVDTSCIIAPAKVMEQPKSNQGKPSLINSS
jgi:hypothetical protein